jgi:hypothetical protein
MDRFYELLSLFEDEALDADGRTELAYYVDASPACLEAFLEAVSDQRIRRLALARN